MDVLARQLIDHYQRDFPLSPRPYAEMAERLGVTETAVIDCLKRLRSSGVLSRVGPVFQHDKAGASTLAAMAVPGERLDAVAALVSGYPEVNHNYSRENAVNLWFVVTAPDGDRLAAVLSDIETRTGLRVLNLPMESAYHIDLGFPIQWAPGQSQGVDA